MDDVVTSTSGVAAVTDWTDPGVFEVAAGVHRIPLPLPNDALRAVNVYALSGPDGLTVIDSGWALALARERLETAMAELGHTLADIDRFLMTHVHRDHYTQAVLLRREFGTRLALGIGERPSLDLWADGVELRLVPQLRRLDAGTGPQRWPPRSSGMCPAGAATRPGNFRTNGWPPGTSAWPGGPWKRSRPRAIPGATCATGTRPVGCCSPATTCCRTSRRRSASSPPSPHYRWPTTSSRCGWSANGPTRRCCRPTDCPGPACMPGWTNCWLHHANRLELCERASASGAATAFEVAAMLAWTRRGPQADRPRRVQSDDGGPGDRGAPGRPGHAGAAAGRGQRRYRPGTVPG